MERGLVRLPTLYRSARRVGRAAVFILVVGVGTVVLLTERGAIFGPSIVIAAGLVLLGVRLNIVSEIMFAALVPWALIAIGSAIMLDPRRVWTLVSQWSRAYAPVSLLGSVRSAVGSVGVRPREHRVRTTRKW